MEKTVEDKKAIILPKPKRKYRSRVRARSPSTILRAKKCRRRKANDRERNRMHSLNEALETLRCSLPPMPDESKLTKIETLRMAHNYILTLSEMLKMDGTELSEFAAACNFHPNPPDTPPFPYSEEFYEQSNSQTVSSGHSPPDIHSASVGFPSDHGSFYSHPSAAEHFSDIPTNSHCEQSLPFGLHKEDISGYVRYSLN